MFCNASFKLAFTIIIIIIIIECLDSVNRVLVASFVFFV
jgi:hypothetical protein